MLEALVVTIVGVACSYVVYRVDEMDKRLDKLSTKLTDIENKLPKRKTDNPYYSPNSGIEM